MTPEQESDLFKTLGRLEAKIDNFNATLAAHTDNDSVNFASMESDLQIIKLARAKEEGVSEELARHASSAGGKMGGFVATVVSLIVAGVTTYFGNR